MMLLSSRGIKDFNDLKNLRRESFVDAIEEKMTNDKLVSYFGNVDIALLYGFGMKPLPLEGLDSYVFEYGFHRGCDQVRSTLVYLKTQKCPILYSSKFFVLDDYCHVLKEELKNNTKKDVVNAYDLYSYLKDLYTFDEYSYEAASQSLNILEELKKRIENTSIEGKDLFLLKFYSRYIIDLDERISLYENVLKCVESSQDAITEKNSIDKIKRYNVDAICPGGIIDKIDSDLSSKSYLICENEGEYAVRGCYKRSKKVFEFGG